MTVRGASASDAQACAAIYAPYVHETAITFEAVPPPAREMGRRIAAAAETHAWLVLEDDERVVGYAYGGQLNRRAAYRWSADVAVYVHGDHRRSGIGRSLYTALFSLLRLQGFHAAHAGITLPNAASVALHEAVGFQPIGVYPAVGYKLGAWHDVGWWQLELRARTGEPAPLRSFPELRRDEAWRSVLGPPSRP